MNTANYAWNKIAVPIYPEAEKMLRASLCAYSWYDIQKPEPRSNKWISSEVFALLEELEWQHSVYSQNTDY